MRGTDDSLVVALHQLERVLGHQLDSVAALSTKASVLLGFSITSAAAVFALDRASQVSHPEATSAAAALLLVASGVFANCYRLGSYRNPPDEEGLVQALDLSATALRRKLVASFSKAIGENRRIIEVRFRWVNMGLAWLVVGIVIYAVGVEAW